MGERPTSDESGLKPLKCLGQGTCPWVGPSLKGENEENIYVGHYLSEWN